MKNKKVIIFDFDGVLINSVDIMIGFMQDSYPGIALDQLKDVHKGNIFEEISKITHLRKNEPEEDRKNRNSIYTKNKTKAPLYPGIKELIDSLAKEYDLIINTSAIEANCIPILEKNGIVNSFSLLATKELHPSKVEKFKIIAERFKQKPDEMLFITDTLGDIREADMAGVPTVAVTWGLHDRSYFNSEKHHNLKAIADTVDELRAFIKSHS